MDQTPVRIAGQSLTTDEIDEVRSPYDGTLVGAVPRCDHRHVDTAVAAARDARLGQPLHASERARILDMAAAELSRPEVAGAFADLIVAESAKPLTLALGEVERAASTFRFASAVCRTLTGEVLPLDAEVAGHGRLGLTMRVPIGVVGAITPFNFPLNLVAHKLAPAIAAGCPVVLKPAHQTPLTGIRLAELLQDRCGLPDGWLHVVTGSGSEVGAAVVRHEGVAMVTFTGSPDVGWGIRASAPRKKVSLELGNSSPVIVEPDANVVDVASRVAKAAYAHAGQSCISVQRVLVHESIAGEFTDALEAATAAIPVGDPTAPETHSSSVIDVPSRERILAWVREAEKGGADVVCGGSVRDDGVISPSVLANVDVGMKVWSDEVFGPVLGIRTYSDLHGAFREANDTRYGLHAAIFTTRLDVARSAVESLDFGGVIINDVPTWRADQMPYGGLGDSGNTREGPRYGVLEMTEIRTAVFS